MRTTLLGFMFALLAACTTVEGTGRGQLNLFSPDQEAELGREAYEDELKGSKILPETDPKTIRVQAIGRRVEAAAKIRSPTMAQRMEWTWTVVDDPKSINAWMVPGGRGAVDTGMVDFVKSDDELAIVMGHEASHALARHGTERVSHGILLGVGVEVTGAATGSEAVGEGVSAAVELGLTLPHSREQESEADDLGLLIAAQAGYDPTQAIDLWRRMEARGEGTFEFLSTHPSEATRIERLQRLMPQALEVYQRAKLDAALPVSTSGEPRSQSHSDH